MIAKAQNLVRLSDIIDVPNFDKHPDGTEVSPKELVDVEVVITSTTLLLGRGEKKTEPVGVRFSLLTPTNTDTVLEDGRPCWFVSRNALLIEQGAKLHSTASSPVLATLRKSGRSYYWS